MHSLLYLGGDLLRRLDEKSSGTQGEACLVFLADAVALQVTRALMPAMCLQVLRNLPFLKELPDPVFEALLASGNLVRYSKGDSIWSPLRPAHVTARGGHWKAEGGVACEGDGIFVVMAGLVKSSYTTAEGRTVVSPFKPTHMWQAKIISERA